MLNKIIKKMMHEDGDINFSISAWRNDDYYTFILFKDKVIVYYLSLQYKNSKCYIDKLDSTGYFRGISKDFIVSILKALSPTFISCFSHPRKEYVFKNSHINADKKVKTPLDLLNFWISTFKAYDKLNLYELFIWSNYFEDSKYPYLTFEEINFFDDDPKTRVMQHIENISVDRLFNTLLCRKDFIEGSLVYLIKRNNINQTVIKEDNVSFQDLCSKISKNEIVNYLKKLDFSNKEKIEKSSKQFIDHFKILPREFKYLQIGREDKVHKTSVLITGKRRR